MYINYNLIYKYPINVLLLFQALSNLLVAHFLSQTSDLSILHSLYFHSYSHFIPSNLTLITHSYYTTVIKLDFILELYYPV